MMRTAVVALLLGAGLTSCASFKKEKSGAELRKEGYDALLKTVKPGMYRRQLYAVLPPHKKPTAQPPSVCAFAGVLMYWAHHERHELDPECHLEVSYQLKNGNEYKRRKRSMHGTPVNLSSMHPITLDTIGKLLMEASAQTQFADGETNSKENPDDIILSVSKVHLKDEHPAEFGIPAYTIHPTQEHGVKFGRERESRNDFPFRAGPPSPFASGKPKAVSDRPPLP
ncbi:hypothetical protein [Roseimicrobium gellanilyticum]|nr:hypothetical protein [Roseimicrobium gellanilyticum]